MIANKAAVKSIEEGVNDVTGISDVIVEGSDVIGKELVTVLVTS